MIVGAPPQGTCNTKRSADHQSKGARSMAKAMVSFFDNFPEYEGRKIEIRGKDGYFCATDMSEVLEKRFTDWRKTDFSKRLLGRLSDRLGIPITWEDSPSKAQTPLIDYVSGRGQKIWVHPALAMSYAMSNPEFQADINVWIYELMTIGTVNPHVLRWTADLYQRGVEFNRDDIREMYTR
jgi:KilA-N domain